MKFSANCVSLVRALGLFLLLMQVVPAQVAPAPSGASSPKEEAVRLSPFVIASERETGWSANDTLSATRTKQALKDVPVNIDAIPADFMEDLGLFSADETADPAVLGHLRRQHRRSGAQFPAEPVEGRSCET